MSKWLTPGPDGDLRCWWGASTEDYAVYHDTEWGYPVDDDVRLFEKVCLEGFQAGLSWLTILRKRDNFRAGFAGFDFEKVARFNSRSVDRLLGDAGIVRHRGKIESTINNAKRALELTVEHGSLAAYFWSWEPQGRRPIRSGDRIPATTDVSTALSKDLKRRGWSFVGPTTIYAFMQAMGLVNDHVVGCSVHEAAAVARQRFTPPMSGG
ncbi:MAG: DNA-3-methyladenine glycosylase I [Acidimicrobiia bacterium]|nr:DNA-3-methyladenine glycosylase I [Acidimicrobiia bacterium]